MNRQKEKGHIAVEAIIILPIAVLSTLLLLYLSLFLFQRASLQAALETTLVYYKNTVTDTYVTKMRRWSIRKAAIIRWERETLIPLPALFLPIEECLEMETI